MIFLSQQAQERAKEYFTLLTAAFIAAVVVGSAVALVLPNESMELFRAIGRSISDKVSMDSPVHTFLSIYLNNLGVATSAYALGIIFGIVSWLVVLFNGFVLGLVVTLVVSKGIIDPVRALLAILPHGVFEIPAIILSATAGMLLYRGTLKKEGLDLVYSSLRLYALSAAVLLLAAFIEAFVTPKVAGIG